MSQTKKHGEPLVAVWLRPSTTEPCICCKQVAEKPRGEHLKNDVGCSLCHENKTAFTGFKIAAGISRTLPVIFYMQLIGEIAFT